MLEMIYDALTNARKLPQSLQVSVTSDTHEIQFSDWLK